MTIIVDITQLNGGVNGTVQSTDIYPAVDVTDTTQAPTGTTKRYSISQLATFIGSGSGGGVTWVTVTGTTQTIAINHGYIPLNVALTSFTMPTTAAVGNIIRIGGTGSGGWKIIQLAGQTIHFGVQDTTTGILGYLSSTQRYNSIEMVCTVANTDFLVLSVQGNITVN